MNTVHADVTGSGSKPGGSFFDPILDALQRGSAKQNGTYLRDYEDARVARANSSSSAFLDKVANAIIGENKLLLQLGHIPSSPDYSDAGDTGVGPFSTGDPSAVDPDDPVYSGSAVTSSSGPRQARFNYLDAPYAQAYNMSRSTAYQEALANTSHQREVADLQAAGLNPVLSANGGSGASVFGGTVYSPGSSAASSGGYTRSKSKSSDFDLGKVIKNAASLIDVGLSLSGKPGTGRLVSKAGSAVDGLLDAFSD